MSGRSAAGRPAEVFVDRLSWGSLLRATRVRGFGRGRLRVLERSAPVSRERFRVAAAAVCGWTVSYEQFLAGQLFNAAGESLFRVARRQAALVAFDAATELIERSPHLKRLNARFERETLRLFVTRRTAVDLEHGFRVILVARALASAESSATRVVLQCPRYVDSRWLAEADRAADISFWGSWGGAIHRLGSAVQGLRQQRTRVANSAPPTVRRSGGRPAVLQVQEDVLGLDRTIRTQPNWVNPDVPPRVTTFIWANRPDPLDRAEVLAARAAGIEVLSESEVQKLAASQSSHPVMHELEREGRALLVGALRTTNTVDGLTMAGVGKLLLRASVAAGLVAALDVRVFVCGESYLAEATALLVAAPALGIRTVAYQYSNISFVSPLMMTTADVMLLFSRMYADNWSYRGIGPQMFAEMGYPYDAAFARVAERAEQLRQSLTALGAKLVVAFFDENLQPEPWAQISRADYRNDILTLARAVLADPEFAVIVKTQFVKNAPSALFAGDPELAQAFASGRYREITRETHSRNVMFPAEAALAADATIGHAAGATAVLEAALAGRRSVMLNPHGWTSTWDDRYRRAHIVVRDMSAALDGLKRWHSGDPGYRSFGDWSGILPDFDSFRDGRASVRLAQMVEQLASSGNVETSVSAAGMRPVDDRLGAA